MKIGLSLSFIKGTLDGKDYVRLFDSIIKFKPYYFTKKYATKEWDENKHKKVMAKANHNETIIIGSETNDLFIITETGTKTPFQSIKIIQERELFLPTEKQIETIIERKGFIVGYLYNEDYEVVQSTPFENNYKNRNYPARILNSIKDTPYHINEFGEKQYDVKNNPGKMELIGYCWLMAGWKIWMGELFFNLVPKDKILAFPNAYRIKSLEDGKIFVQLFENIEESTSIENMERQREWRKWLGFEKLISSYFTSKINLF